MIRSLPAVRHVVHRSPAHADLHGHVVAPPWAGPGSRLLVVLHGTERNPLDYLAAWTGWAATHDTVVLCPHFDRGGWPGARGYVLGGLLDGDLPRPPAAWAFTALTGLAARVARDHRLADPRFDLWGHSAGAQFVHRYLLFAPDAPVRAAIAANAGWYTLPDPAEPFPYGTEHPALGLGPAELRAWVARPMVIMRGTADTVRDATLRVSPGADRQGRHRHARAATMLAAGRAVGGCRWTLRDVPGVGHDFAAMAPAAQGLLARVNST